MPLVRVATFMDVDISDRVTGWGDLEEIKDVLLANATFMTSEHTLELSNRGGAFSPGPGSLTGGLNWYNQSIFISVDGRVIYQGLVKNIATNNSRTLARITSENIFKQPAETVIAATATAANPGDAMLAIAQLGADASLIDGPSFLLAGAAARAAGATIDYTFPAAGNVTVLAALQALGALSSISVFVLNNRITARAFAPFQGDGVDLRFEINDSFVREWGDFSFDFSSFNNRVTVGFTGGGTIERNDLVNQKKNNIVRAFGFSPTDKVVASNSASAIFFGDTYLARAGFRRGLLRVAAGAQFKNVVIGDRFPVTNARLNLSGFPMEALEVKPKLDTEEFEITLAQLQPA